MRNWTTIFAAMVVGLPGLYFTRNSLGRQVPTAHYALVQDVSDSMPNTCTADVEVIRALMSHARSKYSTLTLMSSGGGRASLEPTLVFNDTLPVPASALPFRAAKKAQAKADNFLKRSEAACTGIAPVHRSPIVKATRRAVEHLRSIGCADGSGCILIVHSDLQDNDEMRVGDSGKEHPSVIDNTGIRVVLCGLSEGSHDRTSPDRDTLVQRWRALFTVPVTIAPFCSAAVLTHNVLGSGGVQ